MFPSGNPGLRNIHLGMSHQARSSETEHDICFDATIRGVDYDDITTLVVSISCCFNNGYG